MLKIKKQKNEISFTIEGSLLSNTIDRIRAVTAFGQTSASTKQFLFVVQEGSIFLVGLTQDVTAYINISTTKRPDGICLIDADIISGLIKKRKGKFKFEADGNELRFFSSVGNYRGSINLLEITDEIVEIVNDIDSKKGSIGLSLDTLIELKRAIKIVTLKNIIFDDALPIHIVVSDGIMKANSNDGYHTMVYTSKKVLECADFSLSITGSAYSVIDKFVANEAVKFFVDSHIRISKGNKIFASIPSIQSEEKDFLIFDNVSKMDDGESKAKFSVSGSIYETINNMFSLKSNSVETHSKFEFLYDTKELTVVYKTTIGYITEVFEVTKISGKKCKFKINEKQVKDLFSGFVTCDTVNFSVFDGRFLLEDASKNEEFSMIGVGTFDE